MGSTASFLINTKQSGWWQFVDWEVVVPPGVLCGPCQTSQDVLTKAQAGSKAWHCTHAFMWHAVAHYWSFISIHWLFNRSPFKKIFKREYGKVVEIDEFGSISINRTQIQRQSTPFCPDFIKIWVYSIPNLNWQLSLLIWDRVPKFPN